jgi:hypothetical protein
VTGAADDVLTAFDVALGQGEPDALAAARARLSEDPALLLEVADAVAFVQDLRALRTEPGPGYARKLAAVTQRAAERVAPPVSPWRGWPWAVVAAAVAAVALWLFDPLRPVADSPAAPVAELVLRRPTDMGDVVVPGVVPDAGAVAARNDLETIRRRLDHEALPRVRESFDATIAEPADRLRDWLDPRNALALDRLDHELRASAEFRREELRRRGGLPAADVRVQQLADGLADDLAAGRVAGLVDRAYALRGVYGAGPATAARAAAIGAAAESIAAEMPSAHGERLAHGLAALCDAAVVDGRFADVVRTHGERLVGALLGIDDDTWSRRLPELMAPATPAGALGEAARTLARLPSFGLDALRCRLARSLVVGALRDRRAGGLDAPDLVAALLYGGADLLPADELLQAERDLRRWQPARLAPDFVLCQQFAWAIEPGQRGHARLQASVRELAVMPAPTEPRQLGAFVLCLATAYAAMPTPSARGEWAGAGRSAAAGRAGS